MVNVVLLTYKTRLLLIIIGHLAVYALGTNIAWALSTPRPGRFGRAVEFVRLWARRLLLDDLLRLAYYLVVPYWVLWQGWVSPLDLGLANLNWIRDTGVASALGVGSLALLVPIWWHYARRNSDLPRMWQAVWLEQPWGWAFVLRHALFLECWWAMCRSPLLLWAGSYYGVYLGLIVAAGAALLNPYVRHGLAVHGHYEEIVLTASLAVVSATLYVFTHNLLLCITVHSCLRLTVLHLVRRGMKQVPICSAPTGL